MPLSGLRECSGQGSCWRIPSFMTARSAAHEHADWDLHPASGELDSQRFGDGSLRYGRMKRLAGGPSSAERILQGYGKAVSESVAWYLRHVSVLSACWAAPSTDPLKVQRYLEERSGTVFQRVDLETDLGAHSCEVCEWSRDTATRARARFRCGCRRTSWWTSRRILHPCVGQFEQCCRASASFLGWLARFSGGLRAFVKFRGWSDVARRAQRQRRMLLGKLVVFEREPRWKRTTHAKFSRTQTLSKTGNFWFCWRCGFYTAARVQGLAGQCRGIVQSHGGAQEAQGGQEPKGRRLAVGARQAACRHVASSDVVQAATKVGWTGVTWCTIWSAT